ncbi:MAG TPA: hypothetical protein VG410_03560 [Solirubrobacteraceae bacterium]|jgi:hypothetical protein|nr:hypothetical protein [Solirubrobacteraceae bacterium]
MSTELETRLRTTLHDAAARIPRATHLAQIDYHPRARARRPRLALGGVATAAGTTAAILALTGGATNAFAGWTPTPTKSPPGQLGAAGRACTAQGPVAGLPLVVSDVRGPFTFQVYANDQVSATCINGPMGSTVRVLGSSQAVTVPAGQIQLNGGHSATPAGQQYGFAEGRTGAGVTAVALQLADGSTVNATVRNRWYIAWWPSGTELKSATVSSASGDHAQTAPTGNRTVRACPPGVTCGSLGGETGGGESSGGNYSVAH